jgi:hypothetical protein
MSQEETRSTAGNLGKWLAIVSATLTIALTALNAYWSQQVSKIDTEIKLKAADLERKRLELDAGKERLARYTFVQNLLSGVLTQDPAQKNLTVNLITLALTEKEAQQLFAGLQASDNQATRNVGTLGSDVVAITSLVLQMNDAVKENRTGAVETLISNYRGNSAAIDQALSLLEPPKLDGLSASGRINILVFLRNTDKTAWTPQSISRAERSVDQIRSRADNGVAIGPQTDDALKKLSEHLIKIKG